MARLLVPALLAWLAGVAWQLQQAELLAPALSGGLMALSLLLLTLAWRWRAFPARAVLLPLAFALLGFASTDWRAAHYRAGALDVALEGRDIEVIGLVAAMPQRNESGLRLRLAVEQARLDGRPVQLPPRIELGWYGGVWRAGDDLLELQRQPLAVRAGERWQFTVRLKAPHGGVNPHGFDYELWLWEQGVQATGYVRAGPRDALPHRLASTWHYPLEQARQSVRDAIFARLAATPDVLEDMPAALRRAGVVAALVTGDQRAIDRADWDVFRATGVAHLMSISGLHITMFAWLAVAVVGWWWRRSARLCLALPAPHAALLGGLLLAALYALFSGWGVPAQRTVLMLATVTLLRLSGRHWPWWPLWLLTAVVVTAVDPWALTQAGFWLSFVAVAVLFASDAGRAPPLRWRQHLARLLREQAVITLALAPLSLLLFGQVSLVGLVANLLAIPWVTLVVTPLALLGTLWAPLWSAAALAVQGLGGLLQPLAAQPWALLEVAQAPLWAGVAGLLGGVLLALRLPWSLRVLGIPLLLPVLLWQPPRPAPGQFELLAADIGQGNAVLVRTATHALLYDAGPRYSLESDAGHRVLVPLLRALGVRLDTLVLSHRDTDHTGGAAAVLAMQPGAGLLSSLEETHPLHQLRAPQRCVAGQHWAWDGVRFEVLHPRAEDYATMRRTNALSCVLRISSATASALLVGDIEQAQEAQLVAEGAPLKADLLLVPHHGSKTSSSAAFLDAVAPRVALAQAGYRNRFGHPAAPVLLRYDARGVPVFDSAHCGAARWASQQVGVVQCQRAQDARYWRHLNF